MHVRGRNTLYDPPVQREQFELHAAIEGEHWWFRGRRTVVAALVAELLTEEPDGSVVLDVGCGTGANVAALARLFPCHGMDTAADAIELARAHFPGVVFHHADVLDPAHPLPDALRLVLLMDVLEHIEDDRAFLRGLVDRLPPGGRLLLTVPANPALWSQHDQVFGHHRRYTAATLPAVWAPLPVSVELLSHYCSTLYPAVWTVRMAQKPFGGAFGEGNTDFRLPPAPINALLERLFAHEAGRLLALRRGQGRPYPFGSSLIALLRKDGAAVEAA